MRKSDVAGGEIVADLDGGWGIACSGDDVAGDETVAGLDRSRRAAMGALVGTALESYDFILYAVATPLVFSRLFFVAADPMVATLGAFATFAVGFVVRPFGAVLFGHIGDRYGRRLSLLATVVMIGLATGCIGLLPTYAGAGLAAPALLTFLRVLQGIALGGEWAGSVTLAVEHAPPERRVSFSSVPQLGVPIGTMIATFAFFAASFLPAESFDAWGWRLPFLAAFPLLGFALWFRRRVEETPEFEKMRTREENVGHAPVGDVLFRTFPQFGIAACMCLLGIAGYYLTTSYVISYGTRVLGISGSLLLGATIVACFGQFLVIYVSGRLGDRFGSAAVATGGGIAAMLIAFPMFALVETGDPVAVVIGVTLGVMAVYIPLGVIGPLLSDLFPVDRRYSGIGLSSNVAAIASGFVPLVATLLEDATGGSGAVALLLMAIALTTALGAAFAPRMALAGKRE